VAKKLAIFPDVHAPYHSESAVECAIKITRWYKPDRIIILGDFLDCLPLSSHNPDSVLERAGVSMQHEFDVGNRLLDRLVSICPDFVYLAGNHETRAGKYIDKHPEVRGLVEHYNGLCFKDRRKAGQVIKSYEYNECHKEGRLYFTHGCYTNQHHAQKHVSMYGRNVIYGHTHTYQAHTHASPIDISCKHMAMSLGCLCDRNPSYMRNAPSGWVHCLGLAHIRDNGNFNIDPIIISDGVASYAGKVFE
jgi:predicted phosphodiesterase